VSLEVGRESVACSGAGKWRLEWGGEVAFGMELGSVAWSEAEKWRLEGEAFNYP
jgi:hypothetical protein